MTSTSTQAARLTPLALSALVALALAANLEAHAQASAAAGTADRITYNEKVAGNGPSPTATDTVRVHYVGRFPDGREFDSSVARGQPAEFPLNRVIKCWTEGVQKMKVGGKAQLICPPGMAYGERGAGGTIPPNATLHFDIELLGIVKR